MPPLIKKANPIYNSPKETKTRECVAKNAMRRIEPITKEYQVALIDKLICRSLFIYIVLKVL